MSTATSAWHASWPCLSAKNMKARILLLAGLGLLVAGTTLYWNADKFARNYIQRDAHSSAWTTDTNKKDRISFLGERISLLGVGLLVVSAFAWQTVRHEAGK